jgi:hypothetical protein
MINDENDDPLTPSERATVRPEARGICLAVRKGTGGGVQCELPLHHRGSHWGDGRTWSNLSR